MELDVFTRLIMIIGPFIGPIISLIVFCKLNILGNICRKQLFLIITVGGFGAAYIAMYCNCFVLDLGNYYLWHFSPPIIEECIKTLIILIIIKMMRNCRFVLNGLLVGAAVGVGFSALESIFYANKAYMLFGELEKMIEVILWRGISSFGSHTAWAAVVGAAIMLTKNKKKYRYIFLILWCALLHSCWNLYTSHFFHILLIILVWTVIYLLYDQGIEEVLDYVDNNEIFFSNEDENAQVLTIDMKKYKGHIVKRGYINEK